jgi:hypothetical protein
MANDARFTRCFEIASGSKAWRGLSLGRRLIAGETALGLGGFARSVAGGVRAQLDAELNLGNELTTSPYQDGEINREHR